MKFSKLIKAIGLCLFVELASSLVIVPSLPDWYANLNKPSFIPPNWVFLPVWTVLYFMMGVSLYLILDSKKKTNVQSAIQFFFVQLVLNFLWCFVFFGFHSMLLGLVTIFLLWGAVLCLMFMFYEISETAMYLLIPYLIWITFAGVLNYFVLILN